MYAHSLLDLRLTPLLEENVSRVSSKSVLSFSCSPALRGHYPRPGRGHFVSQAGSSPSAPNLIKAIISATQLFSAAGLKAQPPSFLLFLFSNAHRTSPAEVPEPLTGRLPSTAHSAHSKEPIIDPVIRRWPRLRAMGGTAGAHTAVKGLGVNDRSAVMWSGSRLGVGSKGGVRVMCDCDSGRSRRLTTTTTDVDLSGGMVFLQQLAADI